MKKRYQIFVSSTFADLEVERGKVIQTVLALDCFPAGMEMFPAMDEEIFEYIKRIIDDSDYYLLIIGGRYGDVDENGVSWTEKEFDYAVSKNIPIIAFDHKDFTKLPVEKTDQDDKKRKKLIAFKKKVSTGRLIKKWTNVDDLDAVVAKSLSKVLELQSRTGWVRADKVVSGDAQKEIERLQKEIESYKNELNALKTANEVKAMLLPVETIAIPGTDVSFNMVHVEGGTFVMGAFDYDEDAQDKEKPSHSVVLSDYWIGETQVTQALWEAVMGDNPSHFRGESSLPVENVSWQDCMEFIYKLNEITGRLFHLPTEAQWEFAAKGGTMSRGFIFAGSNRIDDVAWYSMNSGEKTHPVASLLRNELGLYDMSGNVCEWCQDWYMKYPSSLQENPTGRSGNGGSFRVFRGGSWHQTHMNCRVLARSCSVPSIRYNYLGLRLVL